MAGMERGAVMRAREAEKAATRGMDRGVTMRAREGKKAAPTRFGGDIPSPRQMTPEQARNRSLMGRPEMQQMIPLPPMEPRGSEEFVRPNFSGLSQEEIDMLNKPAPNINDAFFGPDREPFDIVEFISNLLRGNR